MKHLQEENRFFFCFADWNSKPSILSIEHLMLKIK